MKYEEYGPINLGPDHWFYDGPKGLTIAYTTKGTMQSIVGLVEIPWSKLRGPIARHQAHQKPKPKSAKKLARKRRVSSSASAGTQT